MKKLLLASTALVMSAGVAAADVSLSGNGRMGIVYDGDDFGFNSRLRVQFDLSGETDGGLAFGGSIRADNAAGAGGGGVDLTTSETLSFDEDTDTVETTDSTTGFMNAGSVFISGEFGRLSMGDVSGAAEFVVGDLAMTSLTGLRDLHENTYLSNAARPAARYDYSFDGFTFAISADEPRASDTVSIAVGYEMMGFGAGVGYERASSDLDHVIGYLSAEFEGITAKATYGRVPSGTFARRDQFGVSVSGSIDAITVSAYGRRDFNDNTHYGVGGAFALGGGASLVGGVVRDGGPDDVIGDFGISFSF